MAKKTQPKKKTTAKKVEPKKTNDKELINKITLLEAERKVFIKNIERNVIEINGLKDVIDTQNKEMNLLNSQLENTRNAYKCGNFKDRIQAETYVNNHIHLDHLKYYIKEIDKYNYEVSYTYK